VSGDAGVRLFVAVDLPGEARRRLTDWARSARHGRPALRLLEAEQLHLTLSFLGPRAPWEMRVIAAALVACSEPVGVLELGAPLWLPPRRPRALAVEVHDRSGGLARLQTEVLAAIGAAIDSPPERRPFRPHVTVARMRAGMAPSERTLGPTPALGFSAERVTLYRSWLSPDGASYEAIESVVL